ncbi:50S ribosomal protein L4 [bioreactor metagenome]|uniref:50S ribosomal protein L4 n=1 Tax=bioreactor metagenome TaxID=1076179 RepID=A0A645CSH5_9ZZZZ
MPKVALYNMKAESIGEIELNDAIFGIKINKPIMHSAVVNYLANQRQGTQSALTRAEVRGGGIKPWRQKGTGRARQGSIRSPQWRHGGIVFAPKPREYRLGINKKIKKLALKSALSSKVLENNVIVIDEIKLDDIKTKSMISMLSAFQADKKALIVLADNDEKIIKSARNIPGINTMNADSINTYQVLLHDKFIITKDALSKLEEVYA